MVKTVYGQGYGRHSTEEVNGIMCEDLDALSKILGEKDYFFKEHPTTVREKEGKRE